MKQVEALDQQTLEIAKEDVEVKKEKPLLSSNTLKLTPVKANFKFNEKYINSKDLESYEVKVKQKNDKVKTEKVIVQRDDIKKLVYFLDDNETVFIDVYAMLNRDITKFIDEENNKAAFTVHVKQRAYKGILSYIVNDMNYIFNELPHIALKCANILKKISSYKENPYDEYDFFIDMQNLLEDENLRNICSTIVNENYTINLDQANEEAAKQNKKSIKKDLQVTDQVNKSFLTTALLQRFCVLFVNQYYLVSNKFVCKNNEEDKERTKNGYFKIFNYCLCITACDYDVANNNKLYKIVEPKVIKTKYNDRVIWKFLDLRSIDPDTVISKIMDKIIYQIICKLLVDTSAVSYFTSVIKFSIDYEFRFKYPIKFRAIKLITEDEDDEDTFDKFQMNNFFKVNERIDIANKITINRFINKRLEELNISHDYIQKLYSKFEYINDLQSHLIKVYFADNFDVNTKDRQSIVSLIAIMSKELITNNMSNLGKIVASKVISGGKAKNAGKLSLDVIADKYYSEAWEKYSFINDITEKDNFILRIALVNGYKFNYTPENGEDEIIEDLDKKLFISEVSQFISQH